MSVVFAKGAGGLSEEKQWFVKEHVIWSCGLDGAWLLGACSSSNTPRTGDSGELRLPLLIAAGYVNVVVWRTPSFLERWRFVRCAHFNNAG